MTGFAGWVALVERRRRLQAYRKARTEAEAMTDDELLDIGLKRYQLGHVARSKVFG